MTLDEAAAIASLLSLIGLVPVVCNTGLQLIERWHRYRSDLVRASNHKTWQVVRPSYEGELARVEDVAAAQHVASRLESLHLTASIIDHRRILAPSTNVVLICGPKANDRSKHIEELNRLPLRFDLDRNPPAIIDSERTQVYTSPRDSGKAADIAIFGRIEVDGVPHYLLWGLHGVGTVGAAKAFASDEFLRDARKQVGGRNFVGVLHVPYTDIDGVEAPRWSAPPLPA